MHDLHNNLIPENIVSMFQEVVNTPTDIVLGLQLTKISTAKYKNWQNEKIFLKSWCSNMEQSPTAASS